MFAFFTAVRAEEALPTKPEGKYFLFTDFGESNWESKWKPTPLDNYTGKWEVQTTETPQAIDGEKMIFMTEGSKYYGLSTKFDQPLDVTDKTLVFQYEVRLQDTLECGGAYMKLLSEENYDINAFSNETKYVIMFGPDKCGSTNKVHFIFRHKNPKTGVISEIALKDAPQMKTDKLTHLYTLIVRPDNTFEILIDGESVKQGGLLTDDFYPTVNPPKEIDDPTDKKPEDWVDNAKMPDPEATKPDDWDEDAPEYIQDPEKLEAPEGWLADEPRFVPDPEATKPEDWDDDIHGDWEAPTIPNPKCEAAPGCGEYEPPLIKNPAYKGKWEAPLIDNPAYKGPWKARQIPNPDYYEDLHPHNFPKIIGAGFELWEVNKNIGFNNIFIGTDEAALHKWNKDHFIPKHKIQEKNMPKETKSTSEANGFVEAIQEFGSSIKDAWMNMYESNKYVAIGFVVVITALPVFFIVFACCRKSPAPTPVPKPAPKKVAPKVEVVEEKPTEEEKPAEETKKEEEVKEEPKVVETVPEVEEPAPEQPTKRKASPGKGKKKAANF